MFSCNGCAAASLKWVSPCSSLGSRGFVSPVSGDLIRSKPERSFPEIAGDIVGVQTYTYDPITQTGTFEVVNAPHLISLGPSVKDMLNMLPQSGRDPQPIAPDEAQPTWAINR